MDTINDRHELFSPYTSQCAKCIFLDIFEYTCKAFPKGIPDKLLSGEEKHNQVRTDQKGNTIFQEDTSES